MEGLLRRVACVVVALVCLAVGTTSTVKTDPARATAAAPSFSLPFSCGEGGWLASTYSGHVPNGYAIDFNKSGNADSGRPVHASADGVVSVPAYSGSSSNPLAIDHDGGGWNSGWASLYLHMNVAVGNGTTVRRGDVVGYVSNVGAPGGHHLHYEQRLDRAVQPARFTNWTPDYGAGMYQGLGVGVPASDNCRPPEPPLPTAIGGQVVQHPHGGRCLDVPGAAKSPGLQVQLYECNGLYAQQWLYTSASELRVYGTPQRCLDVRNAVFVSGTPVQIWECNGGEAQKWALNGDGTITIGGLCLDAANAGTTNGTPIWLYTCNGGVAQQWIGPAVANGGQTIQHPNAGRCLDVPGATTLRGTQVQLYDCNGMYAQQWLYTAASELRVYKNHCLDVRNGSLVSGTPVQIWDCNGGHAQKWSLNSDGTITIGGLCLDATNAGTANGTPIWLYTCNGGVAQRWTWPVVPSPPAPPIVDGVGSPGGVAPATPPITPSSDTGTALATPMPPRGVRAPRITGTRKVGARLRCDRGSWSPAAASYRFHWMRARKTIRGATASTYTVKRADRLRLLSCVVTASNPGGRASARSPGVRIR